MAENGTIINLHRTSEQGSLADLVAFTGLDGIRVVEVGSYNGEGARIFSMNPHVAEVWCVDSFTPWSDDRDVVSNSNFRGAELELDRVVSESGDKVHKFKGTFDEFVKSHRSFRPDLVYIDGHFPEYRKNIFTALRFGAKFISGHDYVDSWRDVIESVDSVLGGPDAVFSERSWIKKVDGSLIKERDHQTFAVCAIAKLENSYIREWVEHYRKLGAAHVYIYDNNDTGGERFEEVIKDCMDDGFVTVVDYRDRKGALQCQAYTECVSKYGPLYDWMAFLDIDEFIVSDGDIRDWLFSCRGHECILMNWMDMSDGDLVRKGSRPVMERLIVPIPFDKHVAYNFPENNHVKPILHTKVVKDVIFSSPHVPSPALRCCNAVGMPAPASIWLNYMHRGLYVKHFSTKTVEEYLETKAQRGVVCTSSSFNDFYGGYFFKLNRRTPEKEKFILEWISSNPGKNVPPEMNIRMPDYRIWTSYHSDDIVRDFGLVEDERHHLFPTHRNAVLENINYMNQCLSEVVTMWYVDHNDLYTPVVGFDHYRRRLNPSRLPAAGECAIYNEMHFNQSLRDQYSGLHVDDFDIMMSVLEDKHGKDSAYVKHMHGNRLISNCCFMMKWDDFKKLAGFMFPVLDEVAKITGCGRDPALWRKRYKDAFPACDEDRVYYLTRSLGHLAERLISAYIAVNFRYYR